MPAFDVTLNTINFEVELATGIAATVADGDKGDIVVSGGGTVWTIKGALKTAWNGTVAWIAANGATLLAHLVNYANPHQVNKTQVGLGYVDNTSDADKPISTATQTALDLKTGHPNKRGTIGFYNTLVVPNIGVQGTFGAGYTQYFPFLVWGKVTVSRLSLRVMTAATSGGTGLLAGIYSCRPGDTYPNALVASGSYSNRVAAIQMATFTPVVLAPGLYYIAVRVEASTGLLTTTPATIIQPCGNSLNNGQQQWGFLSTESYAALPSVAPAGMTANTPTSPILIQYA